MKMHPNFPKLKIVLEEIKDNLCIYHVPGTLHKSRPEIEDRLNELFIQYKDLADGMEYKLRNMNYPEARGIFQNVEFVE